MTSLSAELARAGVTTLQQVRRVHVDGGGDGRAEADRLVDGGADLVVVDADDDGGPAAATAVAAVLDLEPVAVVGTAATPDWAGRVVAVRANLLRVRPHQRDPGGLLAALGDERLTRTAELLAQLAERRTPALLGSTATVLAAALLAERLAPGAPTWWLAGGRPEDPAGQAALDALRLAPLLDLGLAGDASRHALALLREAVAGA